MIGHYITPATAGCTSLVIGLTYLARIGHYITTAIAGGTTPVIALTYLARIGHYITKGHSMRYNACGKTYL